MQAVCPLMAKWAIKGVRWSTEFWSPLGMEMLRRDVGSWRSAQRDLATDKASVSACWEQLLVVVTVGAVRKRSVAGIAELAATLLASG
jgi:hypothetical protein